MLKKLRTYGRFLWFAGALMLLALAGCGGKGTTNVVTISVSPTVATVIVTQSLTLTATVSGSTDTTISSWTCQYQTKSFDSTGKETDGTLQNCNSDSGNIPPANSTSTTNTTVTFTAPSQVPDPTKISGNNCTSSSQACALVIIITATAHADTKKTAKATISLDSGIVVSLNPTTATVPTGEQQLFSVTLSNDLQGLGVKWLLTQGTPTTSLPYPSLTSCESTCGSFVTKDKATATYLAPSTVPTTATLTIVATSVADNTRFAIGTITIEKSGPIQFNTISPTIAPEGASFYDIFLDAPGISSASVVTLTRKSDSSQIVLNTSTNQLKVLFPIPTSSNTNPTSTGARVRLNASDLEAADTYTVSISDPNPSVTVTTCTGSPLPSGCSAAGVFSFDVVPVRPSTVASIPDSVPQNGTTNDFRMGVNGGYFGNTGDLANVTFNGTAVFPDPLLTSSSRHLNLAFDSSQVNSALPGLYKLAVSRTKPPLPAQNNPSVTPVAVFPDYSTTPPALVGSPVPAGTNPSAVDIDTRLGILAVAETGSNLVQFFTIGNGSLAPIACPTSCGVPAPTGLSINQANHTVAVVSPQDQSVVVLPLPGSAGAPGVTYPLTISLANLIPGNVTPLPLPYSVGVDSDTNNAIVAYSSSANPTTAKVGFLLDLNKDSQACFPGAAQTTPPCVHAQVTLNTGPYPQIAMLPHSHQAMVTPGGAGVLSTIDVTKSSSQLTIDTVSLISGLVTVTVNLASGQTLGLNPGNPGTVLIQGIPVTSNKTNFNGVFTVQSVLNFNSFTYALNSTTNDSATCSTDTDPTKNACQVFFSTPNVTTGNLSQTLQGIAINPLTLTAAFADADATGNNGPQIDLLNSLDPTTTSSIFFYAGCTTATTKIPCSGAPELLGTSSVAFQPYSNMLVSYNPQQRQVSISNPVTSRRTAFVCNPGGMPVSSCITNPDPTIVGQQTTFQNQITLPGTGTANITVSGNNLTLFGGLAVDPATNQAFVVESGSGQILIVNLGTLASTTLKSAEITELQVPTVSGATIGGIAGALMPQGTLTSANDLAGVQIFGAGFDPTTQVFLDGTVIPTGNVQFINSRQLTVTIPKSFLAMPHHYAVTVINGSGVQSNATDFFVIKAVDLSANAKICTNSSGTGLNAQPNSVAIADQLPGQGFSPIAVVTNSGCGNVAIVDINPASATFGSLVGAKTIATGNGPAGVAVSPRFGLAVVANNTDGTASVLDLVAGKQKVAAVTIGSNPTGVAIDEGTGAALLANTGSATVSELNLALLFGSSPATSLTATTIAVDQSPIAVAIDPDRGTNNRGLAVVSALQLVSGGAALGVLDAIDIGGTTPAKSTAASAGNVTAVPTGVVFNPCPFSAFTATPDVCSSTPALFYAVSSGGNLVTSYNPDSGATSTVHVGINPQSLAINPQTGGIITVNTVGQTISIIDTISNPFRTRRTYGLGGSSQFGVAIDQFTNMMVLADQANNRLLISEIPN